MSEKPEEQPDEAAAADEIASGDPVAPGERAEDAASPEGGHEQQDASVPLPAEMPDLGALPEESELDASASVEDSPEHAVAAGEVPAGEEPPVKKKKTKAERARPIEEMSAAEMEETESLDRDWFILKVQSNREKSIRDALERRVKVAGLERFFGDIIVPTEDVAEYKNGKRKVTKRKLWPGYIVVNMAINDDTWFLVRETPGIGDFTGSIGKPSPMLPHEVERIIPKAAVASDEPQQIKIGIRFKQGDRVRVKDGYFQNFEGEVDAIDEANGRVTVMISIFGRSTPVELEHWQIEDL